MFKTGVKKIIPFKERVLPVVPVRSLKYSLLLSFSSLNLVQSIAKLNSDLLPNLKCT